MKLRTSIAAVGAAAIVGMGAYALPAAVASPAVHSHTLKFTAVTNKNIAFTRTSFGNQETDVKAGKTIGFDVVYAAITGKTKATANATFDFKGGLLYAVATSTNGITFTGRVTGGTGAFKRAAGTIKVKTGSSNKAAITIIYHT